MHWLWTFAAGIIVPILAAEVAGAVIAKGLMYGIDLILLCLIFLAAFAGEQSSTSDEEQSSTSDEDTAIDCSDAAAAAGKMLLTFAVGNMVSFWYICP